MEFVTEKYNLLEEHTSKKSHSIKTSDQLKFILINQLIIGKC